MSRIRLDHQSAVGQTGWAAFDWNFSANGTQFTFLAGCCDAARVQLDRYRRILLPTAFPWHWLVFGWSTQDFRLDVYDVAANGYFRTRANQRRQTTEPVDTAINAVRELRDDGPGGVSPGLFRNNFTSAGIAYQSATYAATQFVRPSSDNQFRRGSLSVVQFPSNYATVQVLVIGLHNARWQMGSAFP